METVVVQKCKKYDLGEITSVIRQGFELLGGIGAHIKTGEKILLKVNSLSSAAPCR